MRTALACPDDEPRRPGSPRIVSTQITAAKVTSAAITAARVTSAAITAARITSVDPGASTIQDGGTRG